MNLSEIRSQVITLSGRRNLITEAGADNGCDYFIQMATRELDRAQEHSKDLTWVQEDLAIGECRSTFQYCRFVSQVWYKNSSGARKQLSKLMYDELMTMYPELDAGSLNTPIHWSPEPITMAPAVGVTIENLDRHGIIILPVPDEAITLYIYGRFYSKPLTLDTDENYWSVNHPDILITATLRAMEYVARNQSGIAVEMTITEGLLNEIDKDTAAWDAATRLVMRG